MATGIALDRLQELIADDAQLVEVLPEPEYEEAHLPSANNIPLRHLNAETAGTLDRERPVVVYCWDSL